MKSFSVRLAILCGIMLFPTTIFANLTNSTEVSCSNYGSLANSCNQCFDAGTDYVGDNIGKAFDDTFINSTSDDFLIKKSNGLWAGPVSLQTGIQVVQTSDYTVSYDPSFSWIKQGTEDVSILFSKQSVPLARMTGGIGFSNVTAGANPNIPALRFEYITTVQPYDFVTRANYGEVQVHKECAFVAPRWCGDGIISNGESCDDGDQNGQGGKCNVSCTGLTVIKKSCDNLTVSTTSGQATLDVNVSCTATNASNYVIDCGNGQVNLGANSTCHYTAGGTFSPRCTVDGTETSPSCTKTVTVTPPVVILPECKSSINGKTLPNPLVGGQCDVGSPVNFLQIGVGNVINYTWNCNAGGNSVNCTANYMPPVCGDGIKNGTESCDFRDPTKTGWGSGGCDTSCNPITKTDTFSACVPGNPSASCNTYTSLSACLSANPGSSGRTCYTNDIVSCNATRQAQCGVVNNDVFSACVPGNPSASCNTYTSLSACLSANPGSSGRTCYTNDIASCNATRQAQCPSTPVACIAGPVTGPQTSPVTAATVGLCPTGQTVVFNTPTVVGNRTNYTWSCNGNVGGNCNASYTQVAPVCIAGSVTGPQTSPVTAATVGLCPVGQTVAFNTPTTVGATTTYTWSCNGNVGGNCSASYTQVAVACVAGPVTGPQINPVTAATPGLCPAGQAVVFNTPTVVGNRTNYTWSCNGNVGGNCNASYTQIVACVAGTVTGTQTSAVTAATPGLCPAGQTVGAFNTTTNGNTSTYTWSCNGNSGGNCSASFTAGSSGGGCATGNTALYNGSAVPNRVTPLSPGLCYGSETVGNFTIITNGNTDRYTWSCNGIAGINCSAFYTPGGGGGGGGGSSCAIGNIRGVLTSTINRDTPGLCLSGVPVTSFGYTINGNVTTYNWSCSGVSGCSASYQPNIGGPITIPGSSSVCGNGTIERPNARGNYEECDTTAAWCDSQCKIATTNPGADDPGRLTITTNPGNDTMEIKKFSLIVGDGVQIFNPNDSIDFETTSPMYLINKRATLTNQSDLITGTTITKNITNVGVGGLIRNEDYRTYDNSGNLLSITYNQAVWPNTLGLFSGRDLENRFSGKTDSFDATSLVYKDTPKSTINGFYASLQYMESPFNIRVSKPVISNTAGGSAFIGTNLGYSVNTVVDNFLNNLKKGNFTTSTINKTGVSSLSSATNTVSGNSGLDSIIQSGSTRESDSVRGNNTAFLGGGIPTSINSISELISLPKLEDNENIRVKKDGNLEINRDLELSGVKTIIIESGDLIIRGNIKYSGLKDSFAFIVKNGNIIIDKNVSSLVGVYVNLSIGGKIEGRGMTPNRLTIDGSLYGDSSSLIESRTYVRGQSSSSALTTGVTVNYSNRAIMSPPPFLSRFLNQYSLERVAK